MKKNVLTDLSELKLIFSTHPDNAHEPEPDIEPAPTDKPGIPYGKQSLRITLDKKHRAGKEVTLIEGFELDSTALEAMAKKLKSQCGIGGSVVDHLVLLQGDQRKKLPGVLQKLGFKKVRVI